MDSEQYESYPQEAAPKTSQKPKSGVKTFFKKNIFNFDKKKWTSLSSIVWRTSREVYHRRRKVYGIPDQNDRYTVTFNDRVLTFFGMPFGFEHPPRKVIENLKKIGRWNPEDLRFINWIRAVIIFPINIILIIPRFLLNVLRLATEYLPLFLTRVVENFLMEGLKNFRTMPPIFKILGILFIAITGMLYFAFKLIYVLGRAITSPSDSVYAAWKAGKELAGDGILGKLISILFVGISVMMTIAAYAILFPLGIQFLLTYAPSAVVSIVQNIVAFLSTQAPPFFISIANAWTPLLTPILTAVGVGAEELFAMVIVGAVALFGAGIATSTLVLLEELEKQLTVFSHWWGGGGGHHSSSLGGAETQVSWKSLESESNTSGDEDSLDSQDPLQNDSGRRLFKDKNDCQVREQLYVQQLH